MYVNRSGIFGFEDSILDYYHIPKLNHNLHCWTLDIVEALEMILSFSLDSLSFHLFTSYAMGNGMAYHNKIEIVSFYVINNDLSILFFDSEHMLTFKHSTI